MRNLIAAALILVGFGAGITVDRVAWGGGSGAGASSSFTDSKEFQVLQETWDLVHDQYVEGAQVSDQELIYGASRGMIDSLGDTGHSRFLDPQEAQDFEASLKGEVIGIGVYVDFQTGQPVVITPIDGSPADIAGIKPGDIIFEIDGTNTEGLEPAQVGQMLRGAEGSTVTVRVEREGQDQPLDFNLKRARVKVEPVTWGMLPNGVAHIRLIEFSTGATDGIKEAIKQARAAGATGIVLDLRDNPGGLVFEAIGVASEFLPEGTVIYQEQERDGEVVKKKTVGGEDAIDLPMAVLINENTASAAEIIAGALHDNNRAVLIGERTFGTGTVLSPFQLSDGSVALIGVSLWLTADGDQIWKVGVAPDEEVDLPSGVYPARPAEDQDRTAAELKSTDDSQLQAGYDEVASKLATPVGST